MAFRKDNSEKNIGKQWRTFVFANRPLLDIIGIPLFLLEDRGRFDHWLMHGIHPEDYTAFSSDDLNSEQRKALIHLVKLYLAAGFEDPGIAIYRCDEANAAEEESRRTAKRYSTSTDVLSNSRKRKRV